MATQRSRSIEGAEATSFDIGNADLHGRPQRLDPRSFLRIPAFHEAETVAQHLAGVLIATRLDELFDQLGLMLGKDDIASRHSLSLG